MKDIIIGIIAVLGIIGLIFGLSCLLNWLTLWLYNVVLIPVFNAPVISFWQMYGLRWLIHLLFGGNSVVKLVADEIKK